jgi:hypothetical protein
LQIESYLRLNDRRTLRFRLIFGREYIPIWPENTKKELSYPADRIVHQASENALRDKQLDGNICRRDASQPIARNCAAMSKAIDARHLGTMGIPHFSSIPYSELADVRTDRGSDRCGHASGVDDDRERGAAKHASRPGRTDPGT